MKRKQATIRPDTLARIYRNDLTNGEKKKLISTLISECEVSHSTVMRWLTEKSIPRNNDRLFIAQHLNQDVKQLFPKHSAEKFKFYEAATETVNKIFKQ